MRTAAPLALAMLDLSLGDAAAAEERLERVVLEPGLGRLLPVRWERSSVSKPRRSWDSDGSTRLGAGSNRSCGALVVGACEARLRRPSSLGGSSCRAANDARRCHRRRRGGGPDPWGAAAALPRGACLVRARRGAASGAAEAPHARRSSARSRDSRKSAPGSGSSARSPSSVAWRATPEWLVPDGHGAPGRGLRPRARRIGRSRAPCS